MAGVEIEPADTITVLGVIIDPQLTWSDQAACAVRKTHNAIHAVHRAARHMSAADRGDLMAAIALPYLDYCQVPMVGATSAATALYRGAYYRAARVAARQLKWRPGLREEQWRTAPALVKLRRWTTWERRRAAERAAAVSTIWHREHPRALRQWLPSAPTAVRTERLPQVRPMLHPTRAFGDKMFAVWAPRVATQVLRGTVLSGLPDVERPTPAKAVPEQRGAPSDEWAAQRRAYHAEVVALFRVQTRFHIPAGGSAGWLQAVQHSA
eukprot:gene15756-19961_t